MTTAAEIVAEARTWKGTPFHHQAHTKGVGVDCYGLVLSVAQCFGLCPDHIPLTDYSRIPDGRMLEILEADLLRVPMKARKAGDVVNFNWAKQPQHLGILTSPNTVIHAHGTDKHGGVVETPLTGRHAKALRRVFRFLGIE